MVFRWSRPMFRSVITAFFVVTSVVIPQAVAQQKSQQLRTAEIHRGLVGLPIRSSDGQAIGLVTEAALDDGEAIVIGEIERPLGLGPDIVVIPVEMFANKGDHIELTLTAEQVRDRLAGPEN
jgi:hypothetical protein